MNRWEYAGSNMSIGNLNQIVHFQFKSLTEIDTVLCLWNWIKNKTKYVCSQYDNNWCEFRVKKSS